MSDSQLLERLAGIRKTLMIERETAKRGLDDIDRRLQAIATAIDEINADAKRRRHTVTVGTTDDLLVAELRTKRTQLRGLIAIARKNNGRLFTKKALPLLLRSGLMRRTKNGSNIIYNVIKRSGRFNHVGMGEYELIEKTHETARPVRSDVINKAEAYLTPKPVQ
jgi:hypothetical protein